MSGFRFNLSLQRAYASFADWTAVRPHSLPPRIPSPMKITSGLLLSACLMSSACTTMNYATSTTPASVQEEWIREGVTIWGGTRIYSIGNLEFGLMARENDMTFKVDPGSTSVKVFYYANRGNANSLFWQTDPVSLDVFLKPNGRYQVQGVYGETTVRFKIVDLESKVVLVESSETQVVRRPNPFMQGPWIVPVFVPVK